MPVRAVDDKPSDTLVVVSGEGFWTGSSTLPHLHHHILRAFGAEPVAGSRVFCRPCLDWSERRPHIAGRLGAALACRCFDLGWVARQRDTRAVAITPVGRAGFAERFGFDMAG